MILEIERLHPSVGLGGFARLPREQQTRLLAWHRVHTDPEGKETRLRKSGGKKKNRGRR